MLMRVLFGSLNIGDFFYRVDDPSGILYIKVAEGIEHFKNGYQARYQAESYDQSRSKITVDDFSYVDQLINR